MVFYEVIFIGYYSIRIITSPPVLSYSQGGGGTCHNFDRDARPIFWV